MLATVDVWREAFKTPTSAQQQSISFCIKTPTRAEQQPMSEKTSGVRFKVCNFGDRDAVMRLCDLRVYIHICTLRTYTFVLRSTDAAAGQDSQMYIYSCTWRTLTCIRLYFDTTCACASPQYTSTCVSPCMGTCHGMFPCDIISR